MNIENFFQQDIVEELKNTNINLNKASHQSFIWVWGIVAVLLSATVVGLGLHQHVNFFAPVFILIAIFCVILAFPFTFIFHNFALKHMPFIKKHFHAHQKTRKALLPFIENREFQLYFINYMESFLKSHRQKKHSFNEFILTLDSNIKYLKRLFANNDFENALDTMENMILIHDSLVSVQKAHEPVEAFEQELKMLKTVELDTNTLRFKSFL